MKKLEEIKVALWEKKQYLCEIGQVTGIQYAFLSSKADGYKQCHTWVKCRDFLHDALRSRITGKEERIFGFSYDPTNSPLVDLDNMRILVRRQNPSSKKDFSENTWKVIDSALAILHCVEKHGEMDLSNLYRVADNEDVYIFEGDSDWMESTFMISLYTLLIRLGGKKIIFEDKKGLDSVLKKLYESTSGVDHDLNYLKVVQPFIHAIVKNRKKLKYVGENGKRFLEDQSVSLFHNYTGVVALCDQVTQKKSTNQKDDKLEELRVLAKSIGEGV